MITLDVRSDLSRLSSKLTDAERRQLPFTLARALTRAGQAAQRDVRDTIATIYDRPTPFTLRSTFLQPARKANLETAVFFKDFAPKGTPAGRYLAPTLEGQARRQKRSERAFGAALGYAGLYLAPARAAQLDAYGNLNRGQLVKVLSALGALGEASLSANGSRGKRRGEQYFAVLPGRPQGRGGDSGGLPPAIYQVVNSAFGRAVRPIYTITRAAPAYRKFWDFADTARSSFDAALPALLDEAVADAIRLAQ